MRFDPDLFAIQKQCDKFACIPASAFSVLNAMSICNIDHRVIWDDWKAYYSAHGNENGFDVINGFLGHSGVEASVALATVPFNELEKWLNTSTHNAFLISHNVVDENGVLRAHITVVFRRGANWDWADPGPPKITENIDVKSLEATYTGHVATISVIE